MVISLISAVNLFFVFSNELHLTLSCSQLSSNSWILTLNLRLQRYRKERILFWIKSNKPFKIDDFTRENVSFF